MNSTDIQRVASGDMTSERKAQNSQLNLRLLESSDQNLSINKIFYQTMVKSRGVMIHLDTLRLVLWYTACDTLHNTIFVIHISDILLIHELSISEDLGNRIYG